MNFNVNKTNMVKCIAIILMLMHHLFYCSKTFCEQYGTYSKFITWDSVYLFCGAAKICVGIFVVMTAYGITRAYNAQFYRGGGRKDSK